MEKTMGKSKLILFFVTLCLTNVAIMADMAILPAIGGIFEAFGDQINTVNFIISGAALMSVVASIVTGKLTQYVSKKTLLTISLILFAIGGVFGPTVNNATYVAVMRSLMGFAWGMVNVLAMGLLAEVFVDESRRSRMMGFFNSAMAAVGAVMGLVAGFLATTSWQSVFKVYWVAIPIILLTILFVPKTPAEGRQAEGAATGALERIPLLVFGALVLSFFIYSLGSGVISYQMALYVAEKGLGDESLAGIYTSLTTVGSAIACIVLGFLYPRLRSVAILIGYVVMALCWVLLWVTNNIVLAGIANFFQGAAFGWGFTYFYVHTPAVVPPSRISFAMGFISAATGLGFFVSTYAASFLKSLMGVPQEQIAGILPAAVVILAVGLVVSLVLVAQERKVPEAQVQANV